MMKVLQLLAGKYRLQIYNGITENTNDLELSEFNERLTKCAEISQVLSVVRTALIEYVQAA